MKTLLSLRSVVVAAILVHAQTLLAWDYEGHRLVNQLALGSLPTNFPAFAQAPAARERIAFLAGEPDRWRNTTDLPLKHFNSPDHFLDIDDLKDYELEPKSLSPFRYEFTAQLATARALHPEKFPPIEAAANQDRTRALIGFLPWTITEYYAKLKSAFSYLKVFEELGTPGEIEDARANVIYLMGVMGHFVGDAAQPLHTTKNYNGWVEANPHGYTTDKKFHAWIDGGYIRKVGLDHKKLFERVRPAKVLPLSGTNAPVESVFPHVMRYLMDQYELVEPLYRLEKAGKLSGEGETGLEGREFIAKQILVGGQMLGDIWLSAWQQAHPDNYLRSALAQRKLAEEKPAAK